VAPRPRPTRIFFAADLHGSQPAFRKFVNAAAFYKCDALVFGGDLMGKALAPIVRENGTYRANVQGEDWEVDADGLPGLIRALETPGFYWKVVDREEYIASKADPFAQQAMFQDLARERLREWVSLAEDRLPSGVRMYLCGGNDDDPVVIEVLDALPEDSRVVASEGRMVELDDHHTMVTVGLSTVTPWDTPREASESEIEAVIEGEVAKASDVGRCVFNFHCPPKDTPIDTCLKLEKPVRPGELPRPVRVGGRFVTTGGGSVAVREAVERYQPAVALHGHIHESGGRFRIGRTQCFNPGSEYVQGSLQGWIVSLSGGRLVSYQHTSG
jgi:Icc-related predicted phosphoesterase